MPFSEVFNALLITYVASEYSIASSSRNGFSLKGFLTSRSNQTFLALVIVVNLFDRLVGFASLLKGVLESLLHTPKVLLAAVLYMVVLYLDCLRHATNLSPRVFVRRVGVQFLKILPLYPFLAVLISCGFMFVISFCEHLHLPLEWLNWPIYYGTLYGPFSLVYFQVKRKIVEEEYYFIPQRTTATTATTTTVGPLLLPTDFFDSSSSSNHTIRDLRLVHLSTTTVPPKTGFDTMKAT